MTTPTTTVPTEQERAQKARLDSAHLPVLDAPIRLQDGDTEALRSAFARRFNEPTPTTETLFSVANVGYRMALRDLAAAPEPLPQGDLKEAVGALIRDLETGRDKRAKDDPVWAEFDAHIRTVLALLTPARSGDEETEVQYEVWKGDEFCSGSDTLADAQHYAMMYGQDGPTRIVVATMTRQPLPEAPSVGGER